MMNAAATVRHNLDRIAATAEELPTRTHRLLDMATYYHVRLPLAEATHRAALEKAGAPADLLDALTSLAPVDAFRLMHSFRRLMPEGATSAEIWRAAHDAIFS